MLKKFTAVHFFINGEEQVQLFKEETSLNEVIEMTTLWPNSWVEWNIYLPEDHFLTKLAK